MTKVRQTTAKTIEDALSWIETTPHHIGSWIDEPGFFVLKSRSDKLRIPEPIQEKMRHLIRPGDHFDNRMFRATEAGKQRLRRQRARSREAVRQMLSDSVAALQPKDNGNG